MLSCKFHDLIFSRVVVFLSATAVCQGSSRPCFALHVLQPGQFTGALWSSKPVAATESALPEITGLHCRMTATSLATEVRHQFLSAVSKPELHQSDMYFLCFAPRDPRNPCTCAAAHDITNEARHDDQQWTLRTTVHGDLDNRRKRNDAKTTRDIVRPQIEPPKGAQVRGVVWGKQPETNERRRSLSSLPHEPVRKPKVPKKHGSQYGSMRNQWIDACRQQMHSNKNSRRSDSEAAERSSFRKPTQATRGDSKTAAPPKRR